MAPSVWFVTGCSSGFGEALVDELLSRGEQVVATARNLASLKRFQDLDVPCMQLDVTASAGELSLKVNQAMGIYGHVDFLVNNAGYAQLGSLEDTSREVFLSQFNTNFFGVIDLTRAFLPFFRESRLGTIIMVSSVDAWVGRPGFGPYTASKHALKGLSECLRLELEPFNIRVLTVEPGTFRTSAITKTNLKISSSSLEDYQDLYKELHSFPESHGSEPGDPKKFATRLIDLARNEGAFQGVDSPSSLPLGQDAWAEIRDNCMETSKNLDKWKDTICSTDFD